MPKCSNGSLNTRHSIKGTKKVPSTVIQINGSFHMVSEKLWSSLFAKRRYTVYLISEKNFRKMILPQALRPRGAGFVVHNRRKFRLLFGAQRHTHL